MKLQELSATLLTISNQMNKAQAEIMGKIEALEAALTDVDLPEEAQVALAELAARAQALDDLVPDAEPENPAQ